MSRLPLLFDLDGTLTNPAPGFLASLKFALETLGVPSPPDEELSRFIGPPLRSTMETLLQTEDRERIERGVSLYRQRLDEGGKFEASVIEGIPGALERLAAMEFPLFVCTSKPEGTAREIVHHFGLEHHFHTVYGARLDGRLGEKADLIAHIRREQDFPPGEGIMIGDTVFDVRGAKANRLAAIAVGWGFGDETDLVENGADRLVSRAEELIPAIEDLSARRP